MPPFYAFAADARIRRMASSGGTLTACAQYLLESGLVEGVLQVQADPDSPLKTQLVCSRSKEDAALCCGSRYTVCSPLQGIAPYLDHKERYAFIGRPCDVMALRHYAERDKRVNQRILIMLSFFCAGIPSYAAGRQLLAALGTTEPQCAKLTYRGNGWPGETTAVDLSGEVHSTAYARAWGTILGRDIPKCCRVCCDGIGLAADITCADGWYIDNGRPDFTEHDGRNAVFVRTDKGKALLAQLLEHQILQIQNSPRIEQELAVIQNHQMLRRATMRQKLFAMKLCGRPVPAYPARCLKRLGKGISWRARGRAFRER